MKEHPILFSIPMVQAIKDERKTMTRRTKGLINVPEQVVTIDRYNRVGQFTMWDKQKRIVKQIGECPYGKPGDILWVRETWIDTFIPHTTPVGGLYYKADHPEEKSLRWKPSIHMPKGIARIWLKITSIKVERLNDITEEDAIKEGVLLHKNGNKYFNYTPRYEEITQFVYDCYTAKASFKTIWNSINKFPFNYRENPWVWVIEFEILSTTGKPTEL
jgi:hypothetical protein